MVHLYGIVFMGVRVIYHLLVFSFFPILYMALVVFVFRFLLKMVMRSWERISNFYVLENTVEMNIIYERANV